MKAAILLSKFSDLLNSLVNKSEINKLQLSKKLQLDRSLLYKYLNGKTFPTESFIDKIVHELCLPPYQGRQLREAYNISRDGEDIYNRRKIVRDILANIMNLQTKSPANIDASYNISLCDKMKSNSITAISGSANIKAMLKFIIDHAANTENVSDVYILMQPDYDFLLELLHTIPGNRREKISIHHAIRFEDVNHKDGITADIYNLETFSKILPLTYGSSNTALPTKFYTPYYYYDCDAMQSRHLMEFMPYFVADDNYALVISNDFNSAIFYSDQNAVNLLRKEFLNLKKLMQPLLLKMENIFELASVLYETEQASEFDAFIIKKDPCMFMSVPVRMYDEKIRENYPNRAQLSQVMKLRLEKIYRDLGANGKFREILPLSAFDYIINRRCFSDISTDMVYILTDQEVVEVLENYKINFETIDGLEVYFAEERYISHTSEALINLYKDQFLLIGRYDDDGYPLEIILFKEKSILDAFYDYLNNVLPSENGIISDKQTILNIMQNKIDEFKSKTGLS